MIYIKKSKLTVLFLCIFTIYFLYIVLMLFITPSIVFNNHTNDILSVSNFQFENTSKEPTFEEMESFERRFLIASNDFKNFSILRDNLFKHSIDISIDYYSNTNYQSQKDGNIIYAIKGIVHLSSLPSNTTNSTKKAYCSYQIDVYPNRKTIVTPTEKKFCIKPLYLYTAE